MTYTEFIKEIENNIAKANCNKLNIREYEEKQKQIFKQIRADAIDEFAKKLIQTVTSMTTGFRVVGNIERIAEKLKEQDK